MSEEIRNTQYKSRLDESDLKVAYESTTSDMTQIGFGNNQHESIEMHIYTSTDQYIDTVYNIKNVYAPTRVDSIDSNLKLYTDISAVLSSRGLPSGVYKLNVNFLRTLIDGSGIWYVKDISTSRKEIRIVPNKDYTFQYQNDPVAFDQLMSQLKNQYKNGSVVLNFGKNNVYLAVNQVVSGDSLVFKLYKPLGDDIVDRMQVVPFIEAANQLLMDVSYTAETETEQPIRDLGQPNKNVYVLKNVGSGTEYKSWNDILSTNPQTSTDLIDHYFSSSLYESTVNVDYSRFENFVFFGSAEERVKNFQYKLQLLEQYSSSMAALTASYSSGSIQVMSSYNHFDTLKRQVLNSFDGYESWLFYESGSVYSSSLGFGEVTQSTWPKVAGATSPYTLDSQAKVNSAQAVSWFVNETSRAQEYDSQNPNKLLDTVPTFVRENDDNQSYLLFLDMMGQYFDTVWLYIKHFNQKYDLQHKLDEGTAKDTVWAMLKNLGIEMSNGNSSTALWNYAFGTDVTGSFGNNTYQMSQEDASKEVWKRILNNLPYLLKTKGTERGIRALITCFGIPATILRIREYGGPDPENNSETSTYVREVFSYEWDTKGTSQVSQSWYTFGSSKADSVEFRFKTNLPQTALLFETADAGTTNWHLRLVVSSSASLYDNGGTVSFYAFSGSVVTSSTTVELPIFNGDYWSVLFSRTVPTASQTTYALYVKQQAFDKIAHQSSVSVSLASSDANQIKLIGAWSTGSVFSIGGGGVSGLTKFSGSFQEFRLWRGTLNEGVFNTHVLASTAYNGNTYTSSFSDLLLRWRFNQSEFYTQGSYNSLMLDSNPSQATTLHGYWSGSNSASIFNALDERNSFKVPNVGPRRWVNNKVRVDTITLNSGSLDRFRRVTSTAYDTAPLDSNRVGIYLSPQDIINDDILATYSDFNIDDFIGSPLDWYGTGYPDLKRLRESYFGNHSSAQNIFSYLSVLSYFNSTLFEQVRKMLPARSDALVGFLIEQNYLERPKVILTKKSLETSLPTYSSSLDIKHYESSSAEIGMYSGQISSSNIISSSAEDSSLMAGFWINVVPSSSRYTFATLEYSASVSNNALTILNTSMSWDVTTSVIPPVDDYWFDSGSFVPVFDTASGAVIGYSGSHQVFHQDLTTGRQNLFYDGCLQTIDTTPDRGLPFETFESTQNTLIVTNNSNETPRLKVE